MRQNNVDISANNCSTQGSTIKRYRQLLYMHIAAVPYHNITARSDSKFPYLPPCLKQTLTCSNIDPNASSISAPIPSAAPPTRSSLDDPSNSWPPVPPPAPVAPSLRVVETEGVGTVAGMGTPPPAPPAPDIAARAACMWGGGGFTRMTISIWFWVVSTLKRRARWRSHSKNVCFPP